MTAKEGAGRKRTAARCAVALAVITLLAVTVLSLDQAGPPPQGGPVGELGSLAPEASPVRSCPSGDECQAFRVRCPGVEGPARGMYRHRAHDGEARGLVVFLSGGDGSGWWGGNGDLAREFLDSLPPAGFDVVQVRWAGGGWLEAAEGERAGPALLGCRPATAVQWVHDQLYLPLGVAAGDGRCGFCVTGNSGGASQASYALSSYGLDSILDGVFPTSGPPHAALAKACLRRPEEQPYWYEPDAGASVIDRSYGFVGVDGPCVGHDESWRATWERDSVEHGDGDGPDTRVHLVLGDEELDPRMHAHAGDYLARLRSTGGDPALVVVPGMGHEITESSPGLATLARLIMAAPSGPP